MLMCLIMHNECNLLYSPASSHLIGGGVDFSGDVNVTLEGKSEMYKSIIKFNERFFFYCMCDHIWV